MVRKETKNQKVSLKKKEIPKKVEKKPSQTKAVKEQKGFFQDIEFNLYIMVYLLSVVVLLMSGVLFYTSELLKATNQELALQELKYEQYYDIRIMKYTLSQFSELSNEKIESILDIKKFLEKEEFDEITLKGFSINGEKEQNCFFNELRDKDLCRYLIVEYDASKDNLIYLTTAYREP